MLERYIPKLGENYYFISHCINCEPTVLKRIFCDSLDEWRAKQGLCSKTKKQAELALKEYKENWLKNHNSLVKEGE